MNVQLVQSVKAMANMLSTLIHAQSVALAPMLVLPMLLSKNKKIMKNDSDAGRVSQKVLFFFYGKSNILCAYGRVITSLPVDGIPKVGI
jgi:hypothetical protein